MILKGLTFTPTRGCSRLKMVIHEHFTVFHFFFHGLFTVYPWHHFKLIWLQRVAMFFPPTCQVRVVRVYVSCLLLSSSSPPPPAQPRPSTHHAQCSLPDLNHDHPRPVFPAGPQPRPSTPSVPCRTSTASIHAKCSLPDLM